MNETFFKRSDKAYKYYGVSIFVDDFCLIKDFSKPVYSKIYSKE